MHFSRIWNSWTFQGFSPFLHQRSQTILIHKYSQQLLHPPAPACSFLFLTSCVSDCQSHAEAMVLSFVGEHSLPLAMAPCLVQFARHMAKDQAALNNLSVEYSSASYKLKYEPAQTNLWCRTESRHGRSFLLPQLWWSIEQQPAERAERVWLAISARSFIKQQFNILDNCLWSEWTVGL